MRDAPATLADAIAKAHNEWCKNKPGGEWRDHIAAAVTAHALSAEAVERGWRAFTAAILREEGMSPSDIEATLKTKLKDTSPADLRKVETTMRAAIAAALDGGQR